jgi:hypothetical protein
MATVYNFVTQSDMEVDLNQVTDHEAAQLMPQHPVVQSLYTLLRAQGRSVLAALTEVLTIQLMSGGQRKFIHVREGGRT